MRLSDVAFRNLGSLAQVELSDLGPLVVIVGRNGSGKSWVFEGLRLFFGEFEPIGGASGVAADTYCWHQRRRKSPIMIEASLWLDGGESETLAKAYPALEPMRSLDPRGTELFVARELTYDKGWRTRVLAFGGQTLVNDDQWTEAQAGAEARRVEPAPDWRLYLFGPDDTAEGIEGRALLMKERQAIAYETDEDFNVLASDGLLSVVMETRGQDPDSWAADQGYSVAGRIPEEGEAPELYVLLEEETEAEPAGDLAGVAKQLRQLVRSAFTLIPAARHVPSDGSARASLIASEIATDVATLGNSVDPEDEAAWYGVRQRFEHFVGKELEPGIGAFFVRDSALRLPHQYIGGGEQSALQMTWQLREPSAIVAIEEPETHLHPSLAKEYFNYLRSRAGEIQIMVATHSPMFIDKSSDACNWLLRMEKQRTVAERVSTREEMKLVMAELGLVPSDMFLKDLVVFVEGDTEAKAVLPLWAEKVGLDLWADDRIGLLAIGGDSQAKKYLRVWLRIAKHAPSDYLVLLDGHAGAIRDELEKELDIPQGKIRVLSKHCIEDYYTPRLVVEAVQKLFETEIQEKDILRNNVAGKLADLLKGKVRRGWKVDIGRYVAARMKQVPDEFTAIFEDIKAAVT